MSIIERLFRKRKINVRQRPFIIEEPKTKEERSVSCQVDDRYCRICFDDKKKEIPITACRCKVRPRSRPRRVAELNVCIPGHDRSGPHVLPGEMAGDV